MGRVVAIDYGLKRTGIAATDVLKIAAHPHKTVLTKEVLDYLESYINAEDVELLVIGKPSNIEGSASNLWSQILKFQEQLKKSFPNLAIDFQDEEYSSKEAVQVMIASGMKKSNRRKKENIDLISAVIILQRYLKHI